MHHVVVGAGPAGVTAAETLRRLDPAATITLIGEENETPYSRMAIPYFLIGKVGEDGTHLRRSPTHFADLRIDHVRKKVSTLDTATKTLTLADGSTVAYDKLCIATGARPVRPPIEGLDLPGAHTCWTLNDARAIADLVHDGAHVVLMGAGFIGSIVLEALALRGVNLTVVEMGDRMVPRMMDDIAGGMLKSWCIGKGVNVLTETRIEKITRCTTGDCEDTLEVTLSTGKVLPAHLVVISAGVRSNIEFLAGSGITTDQGILIDDHLRTSAPDVWAAGDVAQGRDLTTGERHVHAIQPTATEHGRIAAQNMIGMDTPYQGSINMNVLDTLGLISTSFGLWQGKGGEQARMVDAHGYRYLRLEFEDDVLVGAQCVGMTNHVGVLRGLIQSRTRLGPWKDILLRNPERVVEAYVGATQLP
ncbi:MAG: pyridine nucleotide-disulfide oxidoreductase [Rhodospirillaceae bacterium BRH_c57]|nr:MAG: pyridine nucleotide-disulfide oxidoreductase [Rhodospirillaceae bacterium BRH_c57]